MRAKVSAVYLGVVENSFVDKSNGETVFYRRANFSVRGTADTFILAVPKDLDISVLKDYQDSYLLVDFRFDPKFNTFKGRLVNVYPTEKVWKDAPSLSQSEEKAAAEVHPF
ncbi:hypothetical protein [Raoultibacter massiliensis]|uniref:hypothetical protein n=1 Tax=Raoultibacter massiliensis TaxID=1852371 RepID=UPI000C867D58|nr:hypothetical protein [Raoultibacter massiliensis]